MAFSSTGASGAAPTVADTWPFVGRGRELRELRTALQGAGAVVVGPPGCGLSTLAARAAPSPAAHMVATPAGAALAWWGASTLAGVPWGPDTDPARLPEILGGVRAGTAPLVVVDGIDHVDTETLALLTRLVHANQVRVLATRHTGTVAPPAAAALWQNAGLTRVDVGPLGEDEVHELLRGALRGPVDGRTAALFTGLAAGSPLLLRELVAGSFQTGTLVNSAGVWRLTDHPGLTPELADRARAALHHLTPACVSAVELLAMAGPVPLPLVARLLPPDLAEDLERRQILAVDADDNVALTDPVLAEVVRRQLPRLARPRLARQLADAVPDGQGVVAPDLELRLVTWLVDSGAPVHAARLLAAARAAVDGGDPQLGERLARASAATEASSEASLLESWCADERGAQDRSEAVLRDHRPVGDNATMAVAIRRAEQQFWGRHNAGQAAEILAEAAGATEDPWPLAARAQQGVFDGLDGRPADVLLQVLPLVGHPERLVDSTASLAATFSLSAADRAEEAKEVAEAALARLAGPSPALYIDPGVHIIGLGFALHGAGEFAAADELTTAVYRHALAHTGRQAQGWAAMLRAHVLAARGRPASAVEAAAEAEQVWIDAGLQGPARWSATVAALAHAELGACAEAEAALARIDSYRPEPFRLFEPETIRARAWARVLAGKSGVDQFQEAAALARSTERMAMAAAAAHDLVRIGEIECACAVFEELPPGGAVTELRRRFATAVQTKDGPAVLAVADAFDALGASGWAAEAWAFAAELLPGRSVALRAQAAQVAGAHDLATPPLQRLVNQPTAQSLTGREAEIVALVGAGLTNRAIADQLVVSLRTVENHLHRAFAKLGVSSRAELRGG